MLPAAGGRSPEAGYSAAVVTDEPMLPDYRGACVSRVVPALLRGGGVAEPWMAPSLADATQVLLLVVDGLGWEQFLEHRPELPCLAQGEGGAITSVVPTTTATALTSITTGKTPAEHGVLGYRLGLDAEDVAGPGPRRRPVLNVLHWSAGSGDMRSRLPARTLQPNEPFGRPGVPVVTRSEFAPTGFTAVHLGGARLAGWRMPSTLVVEARRLLHQGAPFVYAYYDGVDKVAHEHGLGEHYRAELRAVDRLVSDLVESLPPGAALVITSDHGQVEVKGTPLLPGADVMDLTELLSGEGRFRWLHARPGSADDLLKAAEQAYGEDAWVRSREQVVDEGWFGGPLSQTFSDRLGDVAVVARRAVAFLDPADPGESSLVARHGSLTSAEMLVPFLAFTNS